MNKSVLMIIAAIVLIGGLVFFVMNTNQQSTTTNESMLTETKQEGIGDKSATSSTDAISPTATSSGTGEAMTEKVKTFAVDASNFAFSVKEMRVKKGDTVKVTVTNKDGLHDWTLDEFNAKTKRIAAGQSETVQFVADKVGTFEYYCSVGNHRQQGMVGKLIVE